MINYAHRGASEYAPENTLSSFYLGLLQGANGIETDVRRTKDGALVLFHDADLPRVTDGEGKICDKTLAQLKKLRVFGSCTTGFYDRIVTLDEFLAKFAPYGVNFAIELKAPGVEAEVLAAVKKYGAAEKTTFTSFEFEFISNIKKLDPSARVGFLTEDIDGAAAALPGIGGEEIAPRAALLDEKTMERLRAAGLGVRAWGVSDVALMKKMCALGVDGMTVNFPDRLFQYLASR